MKYVSTRGAHHAPGTELSFCDVLISGLAADGGLMVPHEVPKVPAAQRASWRHLSYAELALEVVSLFATDIPRADLKRMIDATYTKAVFGTEAITPIVPLEPGLCLLQLSNGPTLAFKDIAMQLLGHLFEYVLAQRNQRLTILGATSGDTGSAAEYAMRGKERIDVFMMSPAGRMSAFQRAQMYSLQEPNIHNIAVEGVFDDCQDIVKRITSDLTFKAQYNIGTVNSINWGRICAQVVYYFAGYFRATTSDAQQVNFCVPSGNFGNVLAGHIAREMGCPIAQLIVATNENNVLDEFFRTGRYRPRKSADTYETSSPSMDISKASNFERFVYDLVGRDPQALAVLWKQLDSHGSFDLSGTAAFRDARQRFGFVSGMSTHADRIATIRSVWNTHGVLIDPHTADGVKVARECAQGSPHPTIVLETALPAKFAATIREAIGKDPPLSAEQQALLTRPQRVVTVPASVEAVRALIVQQARLP